MSMRNCRSHPSYVEDGPATIAVVGDVANTAAATRLLTDSRCSTVRPCVQTIIKALINSTFSYLHNPSHNTTASSSQHYYLPSLPLLEKHTAYVVDVELAQHALAVVGERLGRGRVQRGHIRLHHFLRARVHLQRVLCDTRRGCGE